MSITGLLLRTQLLNYFSANEILEPESKKRNTAVIVGLGVLTMVLFLCTYNILTATTLVQMGEEKLIPAYMVAISSFLILLLTMFRSNGILFGSKDYDMLSALPIKASDIISSKFLFMYLLNLVISFVFMVPGGIVWILNSPLNIPHLLLYFIAVFFVPLIPMSIAAVIGVLIVVVSSRFKKKTLFSLIFSFVALGMVGYFGFSSMQSGHEPGNLGSMLAGQISSMYPLSKWFLSNANQHMLISMGSFIIISTITFFIFIKVIGAKYGRINFFVTSSVQHTVRRKESLKQRSSLQALYQKEWGRFFSSYMYVLNTGLGVVMLCVFSILLLLISPEELGEYTGMEDMNRFLGQYAPIMVSMLLSLSNPAASSISLEGKNIWILQSSPVSVKTILNSKLAVNLTLHGFAYIIAVLSITARIKMEAWQMISLLFVPIAYSLFTIVIGIFLNLRYPNYEWDNEMMVVKQSIPVIASSLLCMIAVAVPVMLNWFLAFPLMPTLWVSSVILLIIAGRLYHKVCTANFF
ncbi:hypothetical protein [Rubeoparvulum massiliense]|uniref:hypothetical protein n=1 Tax=Rubeoparvulum massiliense TaxID=1631346 RepID=UPI00065DE32A|nr:hypothetical protein [Rubeoparvulum massiliense]